MTEQIGSYLPIIGKSAVVLVNGVYVSVSVSDLDEDNNRVVSINLTNTYGNPNAKNTIEIYRGK